MKQYNLSQLVSSCRSSLLSYMCSSIPVGNHASQRRLGEEIFKRWEADTFKGPYIEILPSYKKARSLGESYPADTPLTGPQQKFREFMRPRYTADEFKERLARLGMPERVREIAGRDELRELWQRPLYEHQTKAFDLMVSSGRSPIVATATGSGKTECFLLPLLYWLLTEPEDKRRRPGVRTLLLYPMNALVEDQIRRLRTLLCWINGQSKLASEMQPQLARPITFGRYVGSTRLNRRDPSPDRTDPADHISELGEMLYRGDMQETPPDILITNFSMLEYMLLRNDDRKLFQGAQLFRLLVLDEIHTYRGTQGMEISCLLTRFDDLLRRKANGHPVNYLRIGLSATLPGDPASRESLAQFATDLFGTAISPESVIVEPVGNLERGAQGGPWPRLARNLIQLPETTPNLWKKFAFGGYVDEEPDEIPSEEWDLLAEVLSSSAPSSHSDLEPIERLGRILSRSPVVQALESRARAKVVVPAPEIARDLFGEQMEPRERDEALGILLQILCAGRVDGAGLLPLRAHFYVKEQREAQLCLNPPHAEASGMTTDGWWKALYLMHRSTCDACGALVFPVVLCRRCGFVFLEAWLRKGRYFPEPDGLMPEGSFSRVLFRPLESIPSSLRSKFKDEPPGESQAQEFNVCVKCGQRIVTGPTGSVVAASHSCGREHLLTVLEWSSPGTNVRFTCCPHCDQEYYKDQEVVTPPMLSPYGAATVLLEEIKRGLDAPLKHSINKVLCFSDSRQQAAKIARRLGRSNLDFVFRQLTYHALKGARRGLTSRQIVDTVVERLDENIGLAELFCERGESPRDTELLRRRVATLLFREFCTEFQTLERLGLVQIDYPQQLLDLGMQTVATHWLGAKLAPAERDALFRAFIDWAFRLNRWAVTRSTLFLEFDKLLSYGYREQTVAQWGTGRGGAMGFCMKVAATRSRRFNFYQRLCKRFPLLEMVANREGFNELAERIWKQAVLSPQHLTRGAQRGGPDPDRAFVVVRDSGPEEYQLQLNFEPFVWQLRDSDTELFRCTFCQYLSAFSIRDVCPVRDCAGDLRRIDFSHIAKERFSPASHYVRLITERRPKPIWVEEHTAQLSQQRRAEIESYFRDDCAGSLDVISGSTTFELGVDLGEINAIFLANLPPEISNYRQRAGRAGRRPGMLPFVLGYVRERPHDKYFWSRLEEFIGGPLRIPWLSKPSREIVFRHANAIVFARLLELYPAPSELQGPPCDRFVDFCLGSKQKARLGAEATDPATPFCQSLRSLLQTNPALHLIPPECVAQFFRSVEFHSARNFGHRTGDSSIELFSDYGILPSYSFPIYVDELVLYKEPRNQHPRCDLKLERDRRIALREFYPGRLIEADKWVLESVGVRDVKDGYDRKVMGICPRCLRVYAAPHQGACRTEGCVGRCTSLETIVPWGGFVGCVLPKPPALDPEVFELQSSEVIFDPASDPEPELEKRGQFLLVARQSAAEMTNARMRMFSPRPTNPNGLKLVESMETDVGDPSRVAMHCLVLPGKGTSPRQETPGSYYLMHEFTTDILRVRFIKEFEPSLLSSSNCRNLAASQEQEEREKARTILLYTLGQALTTAAARHLQVDLRELDFTLRFVPGNVALNTEFILFDTAPGGAGYASRCSEASELCGIFLEAVRLLDCQCGDSCYDCLRSYSNQWMHARLNRKFAFEGLQRFLRENW
jgi:DEAD/DEAH box helicase/Helicase conserved C-terminal domain/MrfA Zn-binding domain